MARIVGILLAAGAGARFGGDKLMARIRTGTANEDDTSMGAASARNLVAALDEALAVVRPRDVALAQDLERAGLRIVECVNADEGMGVTLACGVGATADADGWVITLGDMPWIDSATIEAVAEALRQGADIAAPSYRGQRGHPVGFSRRYVDALQTLSGDAGARTLITQHLAQVTWIDVDDEGVLHDVDTRDDLGRGFSRRPPVGRA